MPFSSTSIIHIVSAMITPAILILSAGNLVSSTLTRLARVVDRARTLLERAQDLYAEGKPDDAKLIEKWLWTYNRRVSLTERALTLYYTAILLFIASSLSIAVNNFLADRFEWMTLTFVLLGGLVLTLGTAALVLETNLAVGTLRNEINLGLKKAGSREPSPMEEI
jgi:hypothetical protein